jgi:hypothetical protein
VSPKLCTTRDLLQLCEECGIDGGSFERHFTRGPPKDLVVVRGRATYNEDRKFKGKVLRVDVPTQLRDEVHELNAFLESHTLEHGTHRGFFRGFNNGDVEGFEFNKGGRLYSAGEDSYQNLTGAPVLSQAENATTEATSPMAEGSSSSSTAAPSITVNPKSAKSDQNCLALAQAAHDPPLDFFPIIYQPMISSSA